MGKTQNKTSALLIIGNEILSGRTKDANTQYIGEKMATHGVPLSEVRVVPDIESRIVEALSALRKAYDYVFTTGGIGPTHDDITASCVAKAFDRDFGRNDEAYEILEEYYGKDEFTEARQRMTLMPEGVSLIPNPVSGAPGFQIENVFVMAGVPRIMQGMLDHVIGLLEHGRPVMSKNISFDRPESQLAGALAEMQGKYDDVEIGSYPAYKDGKLSTNVVVRGMDEDALDQALEEIKKII